MSSITDDGVPAYLKSLVNGADADDQATKDAHSSRAQVAPDTGNCFPYQPHLDNRGGDGGGWVQQGGNWHITWNQVAFQLQGTW